MSEGLDKPCLGLSCGQSDQVDRDALIAAVAAAQPRTIVVLRPGQRRRVTFRLDDRAFSYWDSRSDAWEVAPGCYRIEVGASSRDLPLSGIVGRGSKCDGALVVVQCKSRRVVTIRLPRSMRSARVTYLGRRARVFRRGGRLYARIDLRRVARRTVTVRARGRNARGNAVRQTRVFRTCARHRGR